VSLSKHYYLDLIGVKSYGYSTPHISVVESQKHALLKLNEEIRACQKCTIASTRKRPVIASGELLKGIMIIGGIPDAQEDAAGSPFIGPTGDLLDKMLQAIDIKRCDVYLTNVIKCFPGNRRDSYKNEIINCSGYLKSQIDQLNPRLILLLGIEAAHAVLSTSETIEQLRNEEVNLNYGKAPVIVTYHPSHLIANNADKRKSWEDLKRVQAFLGAPSEK
jgi:uracil-DNA glycosylase family 4